MKMYLAIMCLVFGSFASAADNLSGGLVLGTHNGFTMKYDLGKNRAFDAALTHALDSMFGIGIHADYLFENVKKVASSNLYFGVGGRLMQIRNGSDKDKTRIGIRAPVGLSYNTSPKMELFGEVAPVIYVANNSGLSLDLGVGLRFKF